MAEAGKSSIVSKVAQTLDVVTTAQKALTFSDIVGRTGFVKSSAHRILSVMLSEGLLEYDDKAKTYGLGPRLIHWAQTAWRRTDLQDVAGRELEAFCEATGLNMGLSILDNETVLYLRTFDAVLLRHASRTGDRAPLHCTAVGKVYLAYMPEAQREDLLPRLKLERSTEYTIQSRDRLKKEIARVRARGYGTADREEFLQIVGLAAPILDSTDRVIAGVSVWTTLEQADMAQLETVAPKLLAMTRRISQRMGHEPESMAAAS